MLRLGGREFAPLLLSRLHIAAAAVPGLHQLSTASCLEPQAAEVQQQLLDAACKHVQQLGWSRDALLAAARDLQLSPACIGMFPRGPAQLVEHVIRQHNQQLAAELAAERDAFLALPLPARITAAVRRRLEMNAANMDSWPQALALLAQPRNSPAALELLSQLLDEVWYATGDASDDASWYTKRALLAAIYTSTELYMLTDFSPGYRDTWQQLERRVQDALWLGRTLRSLAAAPQQLLELLLSRAAASPGSSGSAAASGVAVPGSAGASVPAAQGQQQPSAAEAAEVAAASSSSNGSSSGSSRTHLA